MASTYRDSAGVERPTRWERVHRGADWPAACEAFSPDTWKRMEPPRRLRWGDIVIHGSDDAAPRRG